MSWMHLFIYASTIIHMGYGSSLYFNVPIWFESPKTKCFDWLSLSFYECAEKEACLQFHEKHGESFKNYSEIID